MFYTLGRLRKVVFTLDVTFSTRETKSIAFSLPHTASLLNNLLNKYTILSPAWPQTRRGTDYSSRLAMEQENPRKE